MTIQTTTNQAEIKAVLDALNIHEVFRPTPTSAAADGIVQIDATGWLVGTNDSGRFTLHFLDGATKAEAWAFFDALHGGCGHTNPRISIVGPSAPVPFQN